MKFEVSNKTFLEKLEIVGNAIPSKSSMESYKCVKINVKDSSIVFAGTNGDLAIKTSLTTNDNCFINIYKIGECLVYFTTLKQIVSKFSKEITEFELVDNKKLVLRNGKGKYELNVLSLNEYPNIEFYKLVDKFSIKTKDLAELITSTEFACATDMKKPILNGVNFNINNNKLVCNSTDSYMLTKYELILLDNDKKDQLLKANFTIAKDDLNALNKIISKTNVDQVEILFNSTNIIVNTSAVLLKAKIIEGNFPLVEKLFTIEYANNLEVNKQEFISILDRFNVFKTNADVISIATLTNDNEEKEMQLISSNTLGSAREEIECDLDNTIKISFNSNDMISVLNKFTNNEKLILSINGGEQPIKITGEDSKLTAIILPIVVNN